MSDYMLQGCQGHRVTVNMTWTLSWLNAETLERAPTSIFGRLVKCSTHGHSFTRLRYMFIILTFAHHMFLPGFGALSSGREHGAGPAGEKSISPGIPTIPSLIPRPSLRSPVLRAWELDYYSTSSSACMTQCAVFLQRHPGG